MFGRKLSFLKVYLNTIKLLQ